LLNFSEKDYLYSLEKENEHVKLVCLEKQKEINSLTQTLMQERALFDNSIIILSRIKKKKSDEIVACSFAS